MAKRLSAEQILKLMKLAPPGNAIKLTNPDEYEKVPYDEFFSQFPGLDVTPEEREKLETLQDQMSSFTITPGYREDKLYVYFILSLQSILYKGARQ